MDIVNNLVDTYNPQAKDLTENPGRSKDLEDLNVSAEKNFREPNFLIGAINLEIKCTMHFAGKNLHFLVSKSIFLICYKRKALFQTFWG